MDEKLKRLTKRLGQAIDQAINESVQVKDLTEQLRQAGYETILMVEATICFARRSPTLGGETVDTPQELVDLDETSEQEFSEMVNQDDLQFLKRLNISIDEEK